MEHLDDLYQLKEQLGKSINNLNKDSLEKTEELIKSLESLLRTIKAKLITYEILQIEVFVRDCDRKLYDYKYPPSEDFIKPIMEEPNEIVNDSFFEFCCFNILF